MWQWTGLALDEGRACLHLVCCMWRLAWSKVGNSFEQPLHWCASGGSVRCKKSHPLAPRTSKIFRFVIICSISVLASLAGLNVPSGRHWPLFALMCRDISFRIRSCGWPSCQIRSLQSLQIISEQEALKPFCGPSPVLAAPVSIPVSTGTCTSIGSQQAPHVMGAGQTDVYNRMKLFWHKTGEFELPRPRGIFCLFVCRYLSQMR